MEAIVTDANISTSLAGLRALGRGGIRTLAVGPSWRSAGLCSRYPSGRARVADVTRAPERFLTDLRAVIRDHGGLASNEASPIIYPAREETIDALLAGEWSDPRSGRLPYPAPEAVRRVRDKRALGELAGEAGVVSPRTLAEGHAGELLSAGDRFFNGDTDRCLVIKPSRVSNGLRTAEFATSQAELTALLCGLDSSEEVMIQTYVQGQQLSLAVVLGRDGVICETFAHEVRRTWPAVGGATAMAVSVKPDRGLVDACVRLLSAAGYWGLAQLDLVRTPAGFCVLDVNTRFYTSMPLAGVCGVNLPAAWHRAVTSEAVGGPTHYREGISYRWLEADLSVLGHRLRPLSGRRAGALWDQRDPLAGIVLGAQAAGARVAGYAHGRSRRVARAVVSK